MYNNTYKLRAFTLDPLYHHTTVQWNDEIMNSYDFQGLKFLFYMFENIEVMPIKWMKVFFLFI